MQAAPSKYFPALLHGTSENILGNRSGLSFFFKKKGKTKQGGGNRREIKIPAWKYSIIAAPSEEASFFRLSKTLLWRGVCRVYPYFSPISPCAWPDYTFTEGSVCTLLWNMKRAKRWGIYFKRAIFMPYWCFIEEQESLSPRTGDEFASRKKIV